MATVHDRYLRMWVIDKVIEMGLENFKAFGIFIAYYKQEYKIKSLKLIHMRARRDAFPELFLQPIIDAFCSKVGKKK